MQVHAPLIPLHTVLASQNIQVNEPHGTKSESRYIYRTVLQLNFKVFFHFQAYV